MSTTPNLRMLFDQYHAGFDNYPAWVDHHKAMHATHPLECAEFGAEWLRRWEAVGRLLNSAAILKSLHNGKLAGSWGVLRRHSVGRLIRINKKHRAPKGMSRRLELLDGTIVREWPAKDDYDDIF